ncbi:heme-binding protein [Novosphingobium sp. BL-52-GroH]|uniref:GlcG/HbpS family heme-binding protein n=1 Tax=Novosphingobium sp. BL-52-GroH TaxID=3349877 RepID=UPI00384B948C
MMTLALAMGITERAFAHALEKGSKPLTIAVVDNGGVPVALQRQDGSGTSRAKLSFEKAEAALALGMPTSALASYFKVAPDMHALLREATGKTLLPLAGGVLVKDAQQRTIGAVGISGGSLDEEERFVIDAIRSLGLLSDPPHGDAA